WNDLSNAVFGPVSASASITEQLPVVNLTLAAPATANSGDTVTYTVTLANVGHAAASQVSGLVTLPDNTQQPFTFNTIAAGSSVQSPFTFTTPATQPTGTISATVKATWAHAVPKAYAPFSAS